MVIAGTATLEDLLSWGPCWIGEDADGGQEEALHYIASCHGEWAWKDVVSARGADELPGVGVLPDADWLWVAARFLGHVGLGTTVLRLFAADCAERALRRERAAGREPDQRSWDAVEVARLHAAGEATGQELARAAAAAAAAAAYAASVSAAASFSADAASASAADAASAAVSAAASFSADASGASFSAAAYASDASSAAAAAIGGAADARAEEVSRQCGRLIEIAAEAPS